MEKYTERSREGECFDREREGLRDWQRKGERG